MHKQKYIRDTALSHEVNLKAGPKKRVREHCKNISCTRGMLYLGDCHAQQGPIVSEVQLKMSWTTHGLNFLFERNWTNEDNGNLMSRPLFVQPALPLHCSLPSSNMFVRSNPTLGFVIFLWWDVGRLWGQGYNNPLTTKSIVWIK